MHPHDVRRRLELESLWLMPRHQEVASPSLPVRLLLGGAAWLTACCLFALLLTLLQDFIARDIGTRMLGLALCLAGVVVKRAFSNDFSHQLGTAGVLAGVGLLMWQASDHGPLGWITVALLAGALYGAAAGLLYRLLLSLSAAVALWFTIASLDSDPASFGAATGVTMALFAWWAAALLLWIASPRGLYWRATASPAALGFIVSSLILAWNSGVGVTLLEVRALGPEVGWLPAGALLLAALPAASWAMLLTGIVGAARFEGSRRFKLLMLIWLVGMIPVWVVAPGIPVAVTAALLGFAALQPAVLVAGLLGLICYLARFYYQLDFTLVSKATLLVGTGLIFLLVTVLLQHTGKLSKEKLSNL